jgi:hypothetical protein
MEKVRCKQTLIIQVLSVRPNITSATTSPHVRYGDPMVVRLTDLSCGLGMAFSGGFASADGNQPLVVKRVFEGVCTHAHMYTMRAGGAAASARPPLAIGDHVTHINNKCTDALTLANVLAYVKTLVYDESCTMHIRKRLTPV